MGINVSMDYTMQYENRENLRNSAKNILKKTGAKKETLDRIVDKTIFDSEKQNIYTNSQLSILKASTQISLNNSLKETLKYLKSHANEKRSKAPVLGEIWDLYSKNKKDSEKGDIFNIEIDFSAKNIFAAA